MYWLESTVSLQKGMNMTVNEYNKKLEEFYFDYFKSNEIIDSSNLNKLSVPMLLKVNENYFDPNKPTIFIFGQETNIWGEENHNTYFHLRDNTDSTIKSVMGHYEWQLNRSKSKSTLITLNIDLKEKLSAKYNVLWSNLYKYSYEGKRITKNVSKEHFKNIMKHQKEFMKFELELFQPEGMIFLTGKNLDTEIEHNLNAKVERINNYGEFCSQLKITSDFDIKQDMKVFRTPHPDRYRWEKINKNDVIECIADNFN